MSILYAGSGMKQRTDTRDTEHGRLPLIGAQISTAGGFGPVPERAVAIDAETVQIFNSNPRTWRTRLHGPEEIASLTAGLRRRRLPLFFHTIYLINLASPDELLLQRSRQALAEALVTGALAGAAGVVTHVGSHRGEGFENAAARVVDATRTAMETAQGSLEAAGRGRLQELAALLASLPVGSGLCLDTAHLFAAGYPVHEADGLEHIIEELREHDLLCKVRLIHLNDSTTPFASRRDRHQNPGEGQIGYDGLARVVRHPALARIPFILEVPGLEGHGPDAASVAVVKSMREGASDPRGAPVLGA
jgi:deoxyribonuclease-4